MNFINLSPEVTALAEKATQRASQAFARIDANCEYNTQKMLESFMHNCVGESHLLGTSGYGYGDRGRDTLDAVFARIVGAEDALVRHSFVSGTATIISALFGVLRPNDTMVSLTGTPYDTIQAALGLREGGHGSLPEFGVTYREIPLLSDGGVDYDAIPAAVKDSSVKVAYIQRSRGYSLRPSFTVAEIERMSKLVKAANPKAIVIVDNCYGEFVERSEPTAHGADLMMGSLIKNPGGGIARTGGYIAGRADLIELCAHRITAPGVGREVGCSLDENKNMYMGLFHAPEVTASAVKTAVFAAAMMEQLGFEVSPGIDDMRSDIIQAVVLRKPELLEAFCKGIQSGAPIDSFVTPIADDMPGYDDKVIMAAGAFNMGASIELSADGPMRKPYAAFLQGGLTYFSGKLGVMMAAQVMLDSGFIKL